MTHIDPDAIAARADVMRQRIVDAGGDPERVRLMAVTKAFPSEVVEAAHAAGLRLIGESYAQEFVAKARELSSDVLDGVEWHFIGRLQTNKVRQLPEQVAVIQSVDRMSLAKEIAKRRPGQSVMVQVNIGDEPQKGGCQISGVGDLVTACGDLGLDVVGLMGVAELAADEEVRRQFDTLSRLADDLGLEERSMGMTGDLELAVAAGSTMVRVGTALFGERPARGAV